MPSKNWPVGAIKKIIPVAPRPASSTPRRYKYNGITVIGPARKSQNMILGFEKLKSFKPFCAIK